MQLAESLPFSIEERAAALSALPERAAIFALFGSDPKAQPYLGKTLNLKRRLARFLSVKSGHSRRLELASRIARIEWTVTGSEFESQLKLYESERAVFGEQANQRMHLRAPAFLRFAAKNPFPRVAVTTNVTRGASAWLYGPFPSRAAAERYSEEMLNLFQLRRCVEDLEPDPSHPGCPYGEMKMCLAPCKMNCSSERYAEEATAVRDFLATRGESLSAKLAVERETASAALEFEEAAAVHARLKKVEAVRGQANEVVRALDQLKALILQPAADAESVALFLLNQGVVDGPVLFSTTGMRHANEQSGSSSLFAQPVSLEPIALSEEGQDRPKLLSVSRDALDERLSLALKALEALARPGSASDVLSAHLCLFTRWHYRPEKKRVGEIFFFDPEKGWPRKAILRGISRVFLADRKSTGLQAVTLNAQGDAR
jgi:excinuclease ABC subunit C